MIIAETSTVMPSSGMSVGQRLDRDLAGDVLEDAALLDAGSVLGALELDRDVGLDLLLEVDLLAVEVHEIAADRMALLLLDDDRDLARALDLEVEQGVALVDEERERRGRRPGTGGPPRRRCRRRRARGRRGAGAARCASRTPVRSETLKVGREVAIGQGRIESSGVRATAAARPGALLEQARIVGDDARRPRCRGAGRRRSASSTVQAISSIPRSRVTSRQARASRARWKIQIADAPISGARRRALRGKAAAHQLERGDDGRRGDAAAVPGPGDERVGPAEPQPRLEGGDPRRGSRRTSSRPSPGRRARAPAAPGRARPRGRGSFRSQSISTAVERRAGERVERVVEGQARSRSRRRPSRGRRRAASGARAAGRGRRRGAGGRRTRPCRRRSRPRARSWRSCCPRRGPRRPCGRPGGGRTARRGGAHLRSRRRGGGLGSALGAARRRAASCSWRRRGRAGRRAERARAAR